MEPVVKFKKKSGKSGAATSRKRTLDSDPTLISSSTEVGPSSSSITRVIAVADSEVVTKAKRRTNNPLHQSSGSSKRRRPDAGAISSSDADDDNEDGKGGQGRQPAVGVHYGVAGSTRTVGNHARQRSRSTSPSHANDLPTDLPGGGTTSGDGDDEGLYKGAAKLKHQLPKGGARFGPVKGPDNVRTITLTDYQPDVCKDYKETGFCGFGDTCKFLHDRSDYMHGWQLDSAFAAATSTSQTKHDDEEDEEVPFACLLCRQPFTDPIVTRCGHYFCSACAIKRFAKTPKCFACGAPTGGIFNKAARILEKMKKKQEAIQAAKLAREAEESALDGIEGLEDRGVVEVEHEERPQYGEAEASGSERSFYEDE